MSKDTLVFVDPRELRSRTNVRSQFDQQRIQSLMASMQEVGLLQPIRCRRVGEALEVIDGARRCLAAIQLNWPEIAVVIDTQAMETGGLIQRQLIADCERENLLPSELGKGIRDLMAQTKWNASETAKRIGKAPSTVSKLLSILSLPPQVLEWTDQGKLALNAAYEISKLKTDEERLLAANDAVLGKQPRVTSGNVPDASSATKEDKLNRVHLPLPGQRVVTVAGPKLDMGLLLQSMQELVSLVKKEAKRGLALDTFAKLLRDKSIASSTQELEG